MGQQQLILLVLATVIVGLAIVVGIAAFTQGGDNANADAMLQDAVTIASDIQSWGQTPTPFGGPQGDNDFSDATFADLGYSATGTGADAIYENINGQFQLSDQGDGEILITGKSFGDDNDPTFTDDARNEVQVIVCSSRDDDQIVGRNMRIGDQDVNTDSPECPNGGDSNGDGNG